MPNLAQAEELNSTFGINRKGQPELFFEIGQGGLVVARICNAKATATIALQGAHILEWTPKGEDPVIWLSKKAKFLPDKPIRGGIPICWPWFGAHVIKADYPAHGFARTNEWKVLAASTLSDGSTQLHFTLMETETSSLLWPYSTQVEYMVTVGDSLQLELVTRNEDTSDINISQALHAYFNVDDIEVVSIDGLDGCEYLDKLDGFSRKCQKGAIHFKNEVDRVYLASSKDCLIHDSGLGRNIRINKQGSASTVVWNPWSETSKKMSDMDSEGYKSMVCIESANAADDTVTISPGSKHSLKVRYDVEKF